MGGGVVSASAPHWVAFAKKKKRKNKNKKKKKEKEKRNEAEIREGHMRTGTKVKWWTAG